MGVTSLQEAVVLNWCNAELGVGVGVGGGFPGASLAGRKGRELGDQTGRMVFEAKQAILRPEGLSFIYLPGNVVEKK